MNTLEVLKNMHAELGMTNNWLTEESANPISLSHMSSRIQIYAQRLKKLEEEEIKDLIENGPKIFGDLHEPTITLLREGKPEHINFGEYSVSIGKTDDREICRELRVKFCPDDNGFTYFIHARATDYGQVSFGIWLSKGEAVILTKKLKELEDEEDYWRQDATCSFCGHMVSVCGDDHGDEMREIQRQYSERDY